jgi:hypothetical protein
MTDITLGFWAENGSETIEQSLAALRGEGLIESSGLKRSGVV